MEVRSADIVIDTGDVSPHPSHTQEDEKGATLSDRQPQQPPLPPGIVSRAAASPDAIITTMHGVSLDIVPEDIMSCLFHDYLRGSMLALRVVSRRWDRLILGAVGLHGSLRVRHLPVTVPAGYSGRVALDLSNKQMDVSCVPFLVEALCTNDNLTALDFSGNNIGDAGVESLGGALRVNASLTLIFLNDNRMGMQVPSHWARHCL
jgi:hypothetical protein